MASENEMNETLLLSQETLPPKSAKDKIAVIAAIALTVLWGVSAWSFLGVSGWWSARYEMTPPEYFSCLTGLLSPVAFIWIAAAYFASERRYVREADILRRYMAEFTHPEAKNRLYVSGVLDSLKAQTSDLNTVYARLKNCTDSIGKSFEEQTSGIFKATEAMEAALSRGTNGVAEKTRELEQLCTLAGEQTEKSLSLLQENTQALQNAARETDETVCAAGERLTAQRDALLQTNDILTDNLTRLTLDVREQSGLLKTASENARDILTEQTGITALEIAKNAASLTAAADNIREKLANQTTEISMEIQNQLTALEQAGTRTQDSVAALTVLLDEKAQILDELTKSARANAEQMADNLERREQTLTELLSAQQSEISAKNDALHAAAAQLSATFKEQNNSLDSEAEKIVARFKTLQTTLDTYIAEINTAAQTAVGGISAVSDEMNGKVESIEAAAEKASSRLTDVGEQIDMKTQLLTVALKNTNAQSQAAMESLDTQTARLNAALDTANDRLESINSCFEASVRLLKTAVDQTNERADSACLRLQKHSAELSDLSSALVSQALVSETSLAQQQKYISAASARVEEIKGELKQQSEDLTHIAELLENRSAATIESLSDRLRDIVAKASAAADKFTELEIALGNKIQSFDNASKQTTAANTQLAETLDAHKDMLDDSIRRMTGYTEEVSAEITRRMTQMDVSADLLKSRTEKAVSQLDEQFRKLDGDAGILLDKATTVAGDLSEKTDRIDSLFSKQSKTMSDASDKLAEQMGKAATLLREQSEQADSDLERLVARIRLLEEGLNVQTKELTHASDTTVVHLENVGAALAKQSESLADLTAEAQKRLTDSAQTFTDKISAFSALIKDFTVQNGDSLVQINIGQTDFSEAADALIQRMNALKTEIAAQTESLQQQSAKSTQQALMVRDSMQRHIVDLGDVANMIATQSRLGEASLNNQTDALNAAAQDVMRHLNDINEAVRQNTTDLLSASSRIGFELEATGENLRQRNDEAQKAADETVKRSAAATQMLQEKTELLTQMAQQVLDGLKTAGDEFDDKAQRLQAASVIARDELDKSGDTFLVQAHQIARLSEESQKAVKNCGVVLRERAADFDKTAQDADARVRRLSDTVHQIGKEFEDMSNKGVVQIDLAGQRLRAMISEVAGNSERIAAEVRKSGEQFIDQSDVLSTASDEALGRLQNLLTVLRDNAKEIQESGEKISAQSIKLGGAFNRQVQSLISASRSAEEYISALNKRKEEADTDRFMKDAAVIIEQLQSLGVDLTRLFSPNVEEDLWKRYYSGDKSAFVRYLSRAIDKNQIRKIGERFAEDAEFRGYVTKYMGTFEGVLSRAQENERADVLTAVLLGSEAGRLYMTLSRVFNKEA